MRLYQCILTNNDCYKAKRTIRPRGVMVHSTGGNNPNLRRFVQPDDGRLGKNSNGNDWDRPGVGACVHAFIGKLADGSIATYQTLPWDHRGWHCGKGSKGSGNDSHISFEICEDGLTDGAYFAKVYREAVELTAYLCRLYGLDPLADGVVICHSEGHARGIASNHADVMHWFPRHGKSMDTFRADVAAELAPKPKQDEGTKKEETELTEEQVRKLVRDEFAKLEAERAALPASAWAAEELAGAVEKGITDGTRPRSWATRQEVALMIGRASG